MFFYEREWKTATGRGLSVSTSTDTNANNSTHSRKKRLAVNVSANRSESNIDICGKLVLLICFLADIHLSRWRWWCCWLQLESHRWIFLRSPSDIYRHFVVMKTCFFWTILVTKERLNCDVFLNLTRRFLCLNIWFSLDGKQNEHF